MPDLKARSWKVTMKGGMQVMLSAEECEFFEGGFCFKSGGAVNAWFNRDEVASVERGEVQ